MRERLFYFFENISSFLCGIIYPSPIYEWRFKRHWNHVNKKWEKLKHKAKPCFYCGSNSVKAITRVRLPMRNICIECNDCHCWCGAFPTVRYAIWYWNKQKPMYKK